MSKFTDLGFNLDPIKASSATPEKDGYVAVKNGLPYHVHPTFTPEAWGALQEVIGEIEIAPYVAPQPYTPTYTDLRQVAYPSIEDQLDTLYHGGYDAWKATIKAVKDTYPKE